MSLKQMVKFELGEPRFFQFKAKCDNAWNLGRTLDKYFAKKLNKKFGKKFSIYSRQYGTIVPHGSLDYLEIRINIEKGLLKFFPAMAIMSTSEKRTSEKYRTVDGKINKTEDGYYEFKINWDGIFYCSPLVKKYFSKVMENVYDCLLEVEKTLIDNTQDVSVYEK